MKRTILFFAAFILAVSVSAQVIKVAAAANLRNVLEEIKIEYLKENASDKVNVTFGSSGNLVQQILNGADFDFFMAADNEFPVKLKEKGATTGEIRTYAFGKLVMWSGTLNVSQGDSLLLTPAVKKIAVAKPETAPYGNRTVEFLKRKRLFSKLEAKIVYADNISQAAQFAYSGNAEIGFTAMSLVLTPEMLAAGKYYIVPETDYTPIEQACVLLKTYKHNPKAAKFMKFVLNPKLKPVWEKWGYKAG
ncbi:MAG: molybdate ABC transporter substrate-binding protein [Dysgonamonadaceae bacterium]|jgi:molybdate transport system substrate-binding protein|nr:molybdate ABC transporter substrate-binding protein [Dysgonamonadaceae bacterium]